MKKEIGSNFWISKHFYQDHIYDLDKIAKDLHLKKGEDIRYLSSCRQAIKLALREMNSQEKIALLPEYTCSSVISPFLSEGYEVVYYSVDKNMSVKVSQLNSLIDKFNVKVLLIHPYFGFDTLIKDEPFHSFVHVIYDATQSLYSDFDYDFYSYKVASLRKWGPLVDGGVLIKKGKLEYKLNLKEYGELTDVMVEAADLKYAYMEEDFADKHIFLDKYAKALQMIREDTDLHAIASKSLIVQGNLEIESLRKSRYKNFKSLLQVQWRGIGEPVFKDIDESITPLYFPIYLQTDRNKFQKYLSENQVYAPIIWKEASIFKEKGWELSEESRFIYDSIICIPVDQRYDEMDMARIKELVECYEENS